MVIEVGGKGRQSDGGTFHFSALNKPLANNRLNVPPSQNPPGSSVTLPHILVCDEAYLLIW
nr:unnamed protein product [Callosobruchus analis]